jgi:hypothetical protein
MNRKEYAKEYYKKNKERLKEKKEKEKHSLLSPSGLKRAMLCPASVAITRYLKEQSSEYAEEGTLFHSEIQKILELGLPINSQLDTEMKSNLSKTKEWFEEFTKYMAIDHKWFELKLPMPYSDKDNGTIDLAFVTEYLIGREHDIYIVDWKYGKGVSVEAHNNPQLISYAVSFLKYLKDEGFPMHTIQNVHTIIYQPRMEAPERIATYTLKELSEVYKPIKEAVDLCYDILDKYKNKNSKVITNNLHPSEEACKFCLARATCKAREREYTSLLSDLREDVNTFKIFHHTNKELVEFVIEHEDGAKRLLAFIENIKNYLIEKLKAGETITGARLEVKERNSLIDDIEKIKNILTPLGIDCINHDTKLRTLTDLKNELKKFENREEILDKITCKKQTNSLVLDTSEMLIDTIK